MKLINLCLFFIGIIKYNNILTTMIYMYQDLQSVMSCNWIKIELGGIDLRLVGQSTLIWVEYYLFMPVSVSSSSPDLPDTFCISTVYL